LKLGLTNDGPIAKFVAIVVASAYGIEVSPGTVAKYLKRRSVASGRAFLPAPPHVEFMQYLKRHTVKIGEACPCALCAMMRHAELTRDKS
jgi:hypothetical protein